VRDRRAFASSGVEYVMGRTRELTRGQRILIGIGLFVLAVILAAGSFFVMRPSKVHVRIATAGRGGTYHPLGLGIAEALDDDLPDRVSTEVLETAGSVQNLEMLERGECEIALVQNDTPGGDDIRLLMPVYREVLHMVVREDIRSLDDLRGRRFAGGAEGSGTARLVESVFEHFGVLEEVTIIHPSTSGAVEAYRAGEVDGVGLVSGLRSSAVDVLLEEEGTHLLSIAPPDVVGSNLDGYQVNYPFARASLIPEGAYGRAPDQAIGTISVHALLVAHEDLDRDLVYDITRAIYRNRVELMHRQKVAREITERFDPSEYRYSLHDGAEAYLRRDEPTFWQRWGTAVSFSFAIMTAFFSALLGLRRWFASTRRTNIEGYYTRVEAAVGAVSDADSPESDLRDAATALEELHRAALRDLRAGRLEANQSFTIFQDYLTAELEKLNRRIDAAAT